MIVGFLRYDNDNGYYISTIDIVSYDNDQPNLNGHVINENFNSNVLSN